MEGEAREVWRSKAGDKRRIYYYATPGQGQARGMIRLHGVDSTTTKTVHPSVLEQLYERMPLDANPRQETDQ